MEAVIAPEEKRITLEGEKEEYETFQSVWLRNRSRAAATSSCPVLWKAFCRRICTGCTCEAVPERLLGGI